MLLALTLCIGLAACGTPKNRMSLDCLRNVNTGVTLSLGMSQKEVEDLLGEGTYLEHKKPFKNDLNQNGNVGFYSDDQYQDFTYGNAEDFIVISFANNSVTNISTYDYDAHVDIGLSNWRVTDNVAYGSTIEDVFKNYGETEKIPYATQDNNTNIYLLTYYYDASGNRVNDYESASFSIDFFIEDSNNSILFCSVSSV